MVRALGRSPRNRSGREAASAGGAQAASQLHLGTGTQTEASVVLCSDSAQANLFRGQKVGVPLADLLIQSVSSEMMADFHSAQKRLSELCWK